MTTTVPRLLIAPRAAPFRPRRSGKRSRAGAKSTWTLRSLLRQAWHRRRTRTLLSELDDRMLKDIGVTRAEADREANKSFWYL